MSSATSIVMYKLYVFIFGNRNTDWESYVLRCNLEHLVPGLVKNNLELEQRVESLNGAVLNEFESSCLISEKKINRLRKVLWWNSNLSKRRFTVRRLFNKGRTGYGDRKWYTMSTD